MLFSGKGPVALSSLLGERFFAFSSKTLVLTLGKERLV
jgi:hypothetical protein